MPLKKQNIDIPIAGGTDTKTADKRIQIGKLRELKNGVFDRPGEINKRTGYAAPYNRETSEIGTLDKGYAIRKRGKELLATARITYAGETYWSGGKCEFSRDSTSGEWNKIGTREPLLLGVENVSRPTAQAAIADVALAASKKYICYSWLMKEDPADLVNTKRHGHISIFGLDDGITAVDDFELSTGGLMGVDTEGIHVVGIDAVNSIFYVWCAVPAAGEIYLVMVDCADLTVIAAPGAPKIVDLHADMVWDVCTAHHPVWGVCSVVAYKKMGTECLMTKWFSEGGVYEGEHVGVVPIKNALTVYEAHDRITNSYKVLLVYQMKAVGAPDGYIYGTTFDADVNYYIGSPDYPIIARDVGDAINITGCKCPVADYGWPLRSYLMVYVEVRAEILNMPATWLNSVLQAEYEFNSANPLEFETIFLAGLASKAWEYDDKSHVWLVHDSSGIMRDMTLAVDSIFSTTAQNTYFLVSPQGMYEGVFWHRTDARCLDLRAGSISSRNTVVGHPGWVQGLSNVVSPSDNKYTFAGFRQELIVSKVPETPPQDLIRKNITLDSVVGVSAQFEETVLPTTELGPTIQTGGGYVGDADGRFQELGFHLYPMVTSAKSADDGTSGTPATWQYCFTYEWTDREGQVHKSAPSVTVTVEAAHDDDQIQIEVTCLHIGDPVKLNDARIVAYRTENGKTTFYRLPESMHMMNKPTAPVVFYIENPAVLDATLSRGEKLYTTGGVLENECPPASSIMNVRQNRLMLVDANDPVKIWPSKEKEPNIGIEFSGFLTKRVEAGGPITALADMDDKEIVFKENQIRAFIGKGPNKLGFDGSFSPDALVTTDAGCNNRKSVVFTDAGLLFKSSKGIYLLSRNMQATYVGAPVAAWNDDVIVDSILVKDKNQVRFLLDTGECLVYEYLVDQWSVFDNHDDAVASTIWQGSYCYLKDTAVVMESDDSYTDGSSLVPGNAYGLRTKTAWLNVAGIQGWERIYWVNILGTYHSPHTLTVKVRYNYDEEVIEEKEFEANAEKFMVGGPLKFRFKPKYQKCEAISLEIEDSDFTLPYRSLDITSVMFTVGSKGRLRPLGASKET